MIASLVYAGVRLDRDENHVNENNAIFFLLKQYCNLFQPSAFHEKLFNSLSIILTNQIRQLSSVKTIQPYPNGSV